MARAPMLNKNDLRNPLKSIAISPLLQLAGTEWWKTLPADEMSAPRAQLSGRALPHCASFAAATRLKCSLKLGASLWFTAAILFQPFGRTKKRTRNFVHSTFHHFSDLSTMTDINYDINDVTLTCMYQTPSVLSKDHIRRSHYIIKRTGGGGSCEGIVARQPGNRNPRHLKRNGTHVW